MMQKCEFKQDEVVTSKKTCVNCGRVVFSENPVGSIHANCKTFRGNFTIRAPKLVAPKVLGNEPDKPLDDEPTFSEKALSLWDSLKEFAKDPSFVSKEEYKARLDICQTCPYFNNNRCKKCGCFLAAKAKGRAFHCPEKKWPGD